MVGDLAVRGKVDSRRSKGLGSADIATKPQLRVPKASTNRVRVARTDSYKPWAALKQKILINDNII